MNEMREKIKSLMKKLEMYEELETQEEIYETQEVLDDLEESLSINRVLLLRVINLENEIKEMKK